MQKNVKEESLNKGLFAAIAYYFAKKTSTLLVSGKSERNKSFSNLIEEKVAEKQAKKEILEFYRDYLDANIGKSSSKEEFIQFLIKKDDYMGGGDLDDISEILNNEGEKITNKMIYEIEKLSEARIAKYISSEDVSIDMPIDIYRVDFGDQALTAFIHKEDTVIFSIKLPEDREKIKYTLLPKKDMLKKLKETYPTKEKYIKEQDKEGNYWEALADVLNSFISKDILTVETSPSSLAIKRSKAIDIKLTAENLIEMAPQTWKEIIREMEENPSPEIVTAMEGKMRRILQEEGLQENDFVSFSKPRKKLGNVDEYIEKLEDENMELANKITKGDSDKITIRILYTTDTESLKTPDSDLISFLNMRYNDKLKYRAQANIDPDRDQKEKSELFADPFPKLLK